MHDESCVGVHFGTLIIDQQQSGVGRLEFTKILWGFMQKLTKQENHDARLILYQ